MPPSSPPGTWSWWTTTRMLSTCASEGPRLHQMCSWTWSAMQYHTGWVGTSPATDLLSSAAHRSPWLCPGLDATREPGSRRIRSRRHAHRSAATGPKLGSSGQGA
eukprot:scaffold1850_cov194-Pinguiococcus_pyrenoidosus.AAC.7